MGGPPTQRRKSVYTRKPPSEDGLVGEAKRRGDNMDGPAVGQQPVAGGTHALPEQVARGWRADGSAKDAAKVRFADAESTRLGAPVPCPEWT